MLTIPLRESPIHRKQKSFGNHEEYLSRITKSLYYVTLPTTDCTSLPVTELAAEIFSEAKGKFSLDHLDIEDAANLSHNACVSPCSLVLAMLYLDRLKSANPKYLAKVSPSELFLISLMVGSKFLQDDGEEDEVNNYEWAASAGLTVQDVNRAEKQFLDAINWEVFVSKEEFWNRLRLLEYRVGLKQGCSRGWFTYSELCLLLEWIDFTAAVHSIWTVAGACLTSYTASVLALLGSALLVAQIPGLALKSKWPSVGTNSCQNWQNESSLNFTNAHRQNLEDWKITPEQINDSDVVCHDLDSLDLEDRLKDCSYSLLPCKLSSTDFLNLAQLWLAEWKENPDLKVLNQPFTTWGWADVIKNYVLRESASAVIFPMASF